MRPVCNLPVEIPYQFPPTGVALHRHPCSGRCGKTVCHEGNHVCECQQPWEDLGDSITDLVAQIMYVPMQAARAAVAEAREARRRAPAVLSGAADEVEFYAPGTPNPPEGHSVAPRGSQRPETTQGEPS